MTDVKEGHFTLKLLEKGESFLALFVYTGIVIIPAIEALTRLFKISIIPGAPIIEFEVVTKPAANVPEAAKNFRRDTDKSFFGLFITNIFY